MRRYDLARREHTDRTRSLYAPQSVERPGAGWCKDDQGGRGVRPYLVAHEQRRRSRQPEHPALRRQRRDPLTPGSSSLMGPAQNPGEWEELAGLVRQWGALRQPVA